LDIQELVDQALEIWDEETNCGETDPAFDGEVGQEIDALVNGLRPDEVDNLLAVPEPLVFVEEPIISYVINEVKGDTALVDCINSEGQCVGRFTAKLAGDWTAIVGSCPKGEGNE